MGRYAFEQGIKLNSKETSSSIISPGDAYGRLFNQKIIQMFLKYCFEKILDS